MGVRGGTVCRWSVFAALVRGLGSVFSLGGLVNHLQQVRGSPTTRFRSVRSTFGSVVKRPVITPVVAVPTKVLMLHTHRMGSFGRIRDRRRVDCLPRRLYRGFKQTGVPSGPLFCNILMGQSGRRRVPHLAGDVVLSLFRTYPFFQKPVVSRRCHTIIKY